uniref:Death domain-containing protein n=1 Tax=Panagrolaimus davidi TaxID=227884 RepID=A0A914QP12_9BILA
MCRQLENLGVDIENESTKLDIIKKLPQREKQELKWWLISESEKATVSELMEKMKRMALKAELAPIRETRPSINFHPHNTRFHSNSTYSNLQPRNTRFD